MKKLITLSVAAAVAATMSFASDADMQAELQALKKEVAALQKSQKKMHFKRVKREISELKSAALNDNIKWNVDFRTSIDAIDYKTASGNHVRKDDLLQNRLWLGMKYAPTSNMSFFGTLAYYKNFGQSQSNAPYTMNGNGFQGFDWYVNEDPTDNTIKLKEAYWVYFGDSVASANIPWTFSIGRRPSTNGLLVNYRDDDKSKSPIGHIINMEFDGASLGFDLSNVTDVPGMYLKFCTGRGFSNATPRYHFGGLNYTKDKNVNPDADLFGFIFNPYNDGQYSIHTTFFYGWHLLGLTQGQLQSYGMASQGIIADPSSSAYGTPAASQTDAFNNMMWVGQTQMGFKDVGGEYGWAVSAVASGIGDGISDFLDDTNAFISYAGTRTNPKEGGPGMLGSTDAKTGSSIYAGVNWPCQLIDDARVGVEYNHGSKYWRPFTYGEDTMAGSKLATRGDAYEAWFTKDLIGKKLSMQLRYTYMNYKYSGSDMFFGATGNPLTMAQARAYGMGDTTVDRAQDFRAYLRYRY